jgi:hypothetical protein
MKHTFYILLMLLGLGSPAVAKEPIYRCGSEYTNNVPDAQKRQCKLITGGNVTVVQAQKPPSATKPTAAAQPEPRVDAGDQRAKDSDARLILESELKKAEVRQAELLKEFNNGEPDKVGGEFRNNQKYLDRVAELKASIARNESDIAGIRRELGRASSSSASAAK